MKQNMSHNIYKNIQNKHGQVWTFKDWKKGNNCCLKKKKKMLNPYLTVKEWRVTKMYKYKWSNHCKNATENCWHVFYTVLTHEKRYAESFR